MSSFSFFRFTRAALICKSSLLETGRRQFEPLMIECKESKALFDCCCKSWMVIVELSWGVVLMKGLRWTMMRDWIGAG